MPRPVPSAILRLLPLGAVILAGGCSDPASHAGPAPPRARVADACFACHEPVREAMTTSRRVHAPAGRDCGICHETETGDPPHHGLSRPIAEGCFSCHADLEALVAGAAAPHGAVSTLAQCANCHDPHASPHPSLLRAREQTDLCLACHDRAIEAADGRVIPDMEPSLRDRAFLHGPVKRGECTACHAVHGASQSRLLRQRFTESFYATFDLTSYALCFECHDDGLVTEERTTTATRFRDGDLNLHYVHVHREEKGRTCRACHEMHGSDLPAHVAESVRFEGSDWELPIGFRPTETGGSCGPGCHAPQQYDRAPEP